MPDSTPRVLVTGFAPFAGDTVNPTAEALPLVTAAWTRRASLTTVVLPTEFRGAVRELEKLLSRLEPHVVIATGLAGGRDAVTPERVAINLSDARIPDNAGDAPRDQPVVPGAPDARFSTLPVKAIVAALAEHGIPARLSTTAGTFVCNHTFFHLQEALYARPELRSGFVHVPWSSEHAPAEAPSIPLAQIAEAIRLAAEVALDARADADLPGGSIF